MQGTKIDEMFLQCLDFRWSNKIRQVLLNYNYTFILFSHIGRDGVQHYWWQHLFLCSVGTNISMEVEIEPIYDSFDNIRP